MERKNKMKKILITTIALTAIGVAVRANENKEIKMYQFFSNSKEKSFRDMINYLNKNSFEYINHIFTDDGIIFSYR